MLIGVKTESGSIYVVDLANGTWERRKAEGSGSIRTESGKILRIIDMEEGRPMQLLVEPVEGSPEGTIRVLTTSTVVHMVAQSGCGCGGGSCEI